MFLENRVHRTCCTLTTRVDRPESRSTKGIRDRKVVLTPKDDGKLGIDLYVGGLATPPDLSSTLVKFHIYHRTTKSVCRIGPPDMIYKRGIWIHVL